MITMTNSQKVLGAVTVALLCAILYFVFPHAKTAFGSTNSNCGGSTTCYDGLSYVNGWVTSILEIGGVTDTTGLQETVTASSFALATSTAFDVANPFTATSTAVIERIDVTGQATTTVLSVGTTTKASGLASTDISPTLINSATIATNSPAVILSGQTTALGTGQVSAGSNTVAKIVVGPSERIAGFATSTTAGMGLNYTASVTGTYKITWYR